MARTGLLLLAAAVAGAASAAASSAPASPSQALLPSFVEIARGPAGGTIWQGVIGNGAYPRSRRLSLVYFPPGFSPAHRYPTLYILHGIRGEPVFDRKRSSLRDLRRQCNRHSASAALPGGDASCGADASVPW